MSEGEQQDVPAGETAEPRTAREKLARAPRHAPPDVPDHTRSEAAQLRDDAASRRDHMAEERDAVAHARDELARMLDGQAVRRERNNGGAARTGIDILMLAAGDRKQAATSRALAIAARDAAAIDREMAALDRRSAAADREAAAAELTLQGTDHLTGALLRRVGLAAIQREMDRTLRTQETMVVAFVDVDGLKLINDTLGHAAGDDVLCEVARAIRAHLRSYDVITRHGGDEFVCSLTGQDTAGVHARFERIAEATGRTTFTFGLAERSGQDTVDSLIDRADRAMIEVRRRRCAGS